VSKPEAAGLLPTKAATAELLDRAERLLDEYRYSLSDDEFLIWAEMKRSAIDAWKRDKAAIKTEKEMPS
jgi:hypothetical protein